MVPRDSKAGLETTNETGEKPSACGLVMPISALDDCSEQHWQEVKQILFDAIRSAGFDPSLVSEADDVGIIQKRIIQNLYSNPIVVCDVSGKNPNVMFELGMRLAFDKPTIIVKDDKTSYSFDTAPIEHLEYPRDLRFNKIVSFKESLTDKLKGTMKKSKDDPNYTPFLKHFGKFTVPRLDTAEVDKDEFLLEEMGELRSLMQLLVSRSNAERPMEAPTARKLLSREEILRALEVTPPKDPQIRKISQAPEPIKPLRG